MKLVISKFNSERDIFGSSFKKEKRLSRRQ